MNVEDHIERAELHLREAGTSAGANHRSSFNHTALATAHVELAKLKAQAPIKIEGPRRPSSPSDTLSREPSGNDVPPGMVYAYDEGIAELLDADTTLRADQIGEVIETLNDNGYFIITESPNRVAPPPRAQRHHVGLVGLQGIVGWVQNASEGEIYNYGGLSFEKAHEGAYMRWDR